MANELMLKIVAIKAEAKDVLSFELADPLRQDLPSFTPGAHVEIHLPNGLTRHYSLCNDPCETNRYVIGVGLSIQSRGGSKLMHGLMRVDDTIRVSPPRNHFPLVTSAQRYDFIAGGIGITPILSMVKWCQAHQKDWHLHYLARNRLRAAFYEELQELAPERVSYHFLDEQNGQPSNIDSLVSSLPFSSHIYCCGPVGLMERVQASAVDRPADNVHFEWFNAAPEIPTEQNDHFTVVARASGLTLDVPPEKSILQVLEENGVNVPFSCREGLCSSCETRVIAGTPDHRDMVLSQADKASNETILICVSRSNSEILELDI